MAYSKLSEVMSYGDYQILRQEAAEHGADPLLLAAIGLSETEWGRTGKGQPAKGAFVLGYGVMAENPSRYAGVINQLHYGARKVGEWFAGKSVTPATIEQFEKQSWIPGDDRWSDNVWFYYSRLQDDYGGAVPSSVGTSRVWESSRVSSWLLPVGALAVLAVLLMD